MRTRGSGKGGLPGEESAVWCGDLVTLTGVLFFEFLPNILIAPIGLASDQRIFLLFSRRESVSIDSGRNSERANTLKPHNAMPSSKGAVRLTLLDKMPPSGTPKKKAIPTQSTAASIV